MSNFTPLTNKFNPSWVFNSEVNPDGTKTLIAASDKTFLIGYYVGAREQEYKDKTFLVHTLKMVEVGNPKQIKLADGDIEKFDDIDFIGSAMSNDILSKVEKGTLVRIMWTGKQSSKRNPSQTYNVFEIGADTSAEKFNFNTGAVGGVAEEPKTEQPAGMLDDDNADGWDDDDFPA